jgi:NADPH:quinone reductase-like Zn-dependent oxidoreductase
VTVRAAGIAAFGDAVRLFELPEPPPLGQDQILIEVNAAGVANWDEFVRTGDWDVGREPPLALGVEAAGTVMSVGSGVDWPAPGDAVMTHPLPLADQGCLAERLVAPAALVAPKPKNASWAEAGAFPVPALTAAQVVYEVLDVQAGETVLVHGAAGVTGGMIVELAAGRGATVIATASPRSTARVMALGAAVVLDYHDAAWASAARDAGVDAAANAAPGGESDAMAAVRDGGRLATITGAPPPAERGVTVANVYIRADGEQLRALAAQFEDGKIHVVVGERYPLAGAAEALARAVAGGGGAALVVEP